MCSKEVEIEIRRELMKTRLYLPIANKNNDLPGIESSDAPNFIRITDSEVPHLFEPLTVISDKENESEPDEEPTPDDPIKKFNQTTLTANIKCPICKKVYKTSRRYNQHKEQFKAKDKCCVCYKQFTEEHHLVEHTKNHTDNLICCACLTSGFENWFANEKKLQSHIEKCPKRKEAKKA